MLNDEIEKIEKIKYLEEREERLDKLLSEKLNISRSFIQKIIEQGFVSINNKIVSKKSEKIKKGDIIEVKIPQEKKIKIEKSDFPIEILYEDEDYLVLNKPAGIVVHPSGEYKKDTIVNIILDKIEFEVENEVSEISLKKGQIRPGIVHRLDREVSGVLIVAKNQKSASKASEAFKERNVKKVYLALCFGKTEKKEWIIKKSIGRSRGKKVMRISEKGKPAETIVRKIISDDQRQLTLFQVESITGRTHQIRVHLSSEGFPIVKDEMYGGGGQKLEKLKKQIGEKFFEHEGIFLHAISIEIFGKKFVAPLPWYFEGIIKSLWGELPPTISEVLKS
jgi:23S rRNA pseudouridine1911/1915/1917 synthase